MLQPERGKRDRLDRFVYFVRLFHLAPNRTGPVLSSVPFILGLGRLGLDNSLPQVPCVG